MTWWAEGFGDGDEVLAGMQARTHALHGRRWLTQTIGNLPILRTVAPVGAMGATLAGLPAVLVSPGPSLSRNGHLLRGAKRRAVIVASSHCLSSLRALDVVPDVVLQLDASPCNHFDGYDTRNLTLVASACTHPSVWALPFRHRLVFSAGLAADGWLSAATCMDSYYPSGGTVAGAQLSMLLSWECGPIALVGQDLALSDEGAYYTDLCHDYPTTIAKPDEGGVFTVKWVDGWQETERIVVLPAWDGAGQVRSNGSFSAYRDWFCHVAGKVGGDRLRNCTEGGAHIDGMSHEPFAAFLDGLPPLTADVGRLFQYASRKTDGLDAAVTRHVRNLSARLNALEEAARICERLANAHMADALAVAEDNVLPLMGTLALPLSALGGPVFDAAQERLKTAEGGDRLGAAAPMYGLLRSCARLLGDALETP